MRAISVVMVLWITVSGCVTSHDPHRGVPQVTEQDRETCEKMAQADQDAEKFNPRYEGGFIALLIPGVNLVGLMMLLSGWHELSNRRDEVYLEALTLCLKPIVLEKTLGSDDIEFSRSLEDLAIYHSSRKRYAEAEPLYRRSLEIRDRILGPEDIGTATRLEVYASVLRKMNRTAEAEQFELRAKLIRSPKSGVHLIPPREK